MGCSSSAQTQVKESNRPASKSPDVGGLQKCDDNLPIANKNDTIPDQTKLGAVDEAELESPGIKQTESLAKEVAEILIPGMTNCALSACQRVDPEGTEPQPVALEEKFNNIGSLPVSLLEAGEPHSVEPTGEDGEPQIVGSLPVSVLEAGEPQSVEPTEDGEPQIVGSLPVSVLEAGEPRSMEPTGEDAEPQIVESLPVSVLEAGEPRSVEPTGEDGEPQIVGSLPVSVLEAGEPQSVEPTGENAEPQIVRETANTFLPEIVEDNKPQLVESSQEDLPEPSAEENVNLVTEIVKEPEVDEEELLIEGETGEKMETEMHCEIVSEGSETKEETGEATATATEIEVTNEE